MTLLYNLALLVVSGLLFYRPGGENWLAGWWTPPSRRARELGWGFGVMALLCVVYYGLVTPIAGTRWSLAEPVSLARLAASGWYDLNSVLFEELVFRGVLLHFLLLRMGTVRACLVTAAGFGAYHWFTQGAWGNPVAMVLVFLVTGLMGYALATAYARTASIVLPLGLHLGWNLTNHTLFSAGPFGPMLLVPDAPAPMNGPAGLFSLALYLIVPLLVLFLVRRRYPRDVVVE